MILSSKVKMLFSDEIKQEFSEYFDLLNKSYLGKLYPTEGVIDSLDSLVKYSKLLKNNIEKTYNKNNKKLIVLLFICILIVRFNIIDDLSSKWDKSLDVTFNFGRKIFNNIFMLKLKFNINNLNDEKLSKVYKLLFDNLYGDLLPESTHLRGDGEYLDSELNFLKIHSKKITNLEKSLRKKSKKKLNKKSKKQEL